jgi:hypothetical protein
VARLLQRSLRPTSAAAQLTGGPTRSVARPPPTAADGPVRHLPPRATPRAAAEPGSSPTRRPCRAVSVPRARTPGRPRCLFKGAASPAPPSPRNPSRARAAPPPNPSRATAVSRPARCSSAAEEVVGASPQGEGPVGAVHCRRGAP